MMDWTTDMVKQATEYIIRNKVENIVLVDRSARGFYIPFFKYWNNYFLDAEKPKVYFINPDTSLGENEQKEYDSLMKKHHPHLYLRKDKPTIVLDTCIHKGSSIRSVKRILDNSGFENVKYGVFADHRENTTDIELDFISTWNLGCYPFHPD